MRAIYAIYIDIYIYIYSDNETTEITSAKVCQYLYTFDYKEKRNKTAFKIGQTNTNIHPIEL